MQPQRLDVPVAGGSLAVYRYGPDTTDVPAVIAAHGITGNALAWAAVARALDDRVALISLDLRGRGRSAHLPGPFGMGSHARDILAVADHLALERPVLVGHSMGAYVVVRFATDFPERSAAAVLVDGGLSLPGAAGSDPDAFLDAFLGPAIARLSMTFPDRDAYHRFWTSHPALAGGGVRDEILTPYVDYDLVGEPPELRSSVSEVAVREDGAEILRMGSAASQLALPARLLRAPRGLLDEPNPTVPATYAKAWVEADPDRRQEAEVTGTNHYTILMGSGAVTVADAILRSTNPQ
jgi:pimeloyl-ACP methyl ester carboxylesterase